MLNTCDLWCTWLFLMFCWEDNVCRQFTCWWGSELHMNAIETFWKKDIGSLIQFIYKLECGVTWHIKKIEEIEIGIFAPNTFVSQDLKENNKTNLFAKCCKNQGMIDCMFQKIHLCLSEAVKLSESILSQWLIEAIDEAEEFERLLQERISQTMKTAWMLTNSHGCLLLIPCRVSF